MTEKERLRMEIEHANRYMQKNYETLLFDSVLETACPHGCVVEPDGECPHGFRSPLLVLGVI